MQISKYQTYNQANRVAKTMAGYKIKIVKQMLNGYRYYVIQCNQNKYLYEDGFVK